LPQRQPRRDQSLPARDPTQGRPSWSRAFSQSRAGAPSPRASQFDQTDGRHVQRLTRRKSGVESASRSDREAPRTQPLPDQRVGIDNQACH
jgi:hypothetical protein